jgi:membrane peptidoglycan carboxypeptidase
LKLISALAGTGLVLLMAMIFAAYSATDLPKADALATAQTSIIYFKDGKTPLASLATQNRQNVNIDQIPKYVQDAVLAAEDRTFRTNSGVDPTSIARAALSNLRGNALQGGSTISQQYVKNVYDQRDRSFKRKAKEMFLAVKVSRQLDKDEILESYLNTIYLGDGAYGIQAAAHAYFGPNQKVEDLTVSQGAFLAGIINAPSLSDPRDSALQKARAQRRWGVVLDAMVAENWLDPATRRTLQFPKFAKHSDSVTITSTNQNGYLRDMVVAEAAKEYKLSEDDLMTGGYKITSTFEPRLMAAAARSVKTMLPKDKPKRLNIGITSIDPSTGAVRAIYGGAKYGGPDTNNATLSRAQGGSTFKSFGLIAALEDGYSLKTEYDSDSPVTVKGQAFTNAEDGESSGYQDLVTGTRLSLNTIYAQLNADVGPAKMAEAAYAAGIPKSANIVPSEVGNVLGSADPHAIDMASAYGTFAAGGIRREPYTIQKISTLGTKRVFVDKGDKATGVTKGTRVFDEDSVSDLTYALEQVVKNGTGTYAQAVGRPVAGKTGTSSDSRSAWFVGYTPQLSTSVMMYELSDPNKRNGEPQVNVKMKGFGRHRTIFGGGYPIEIWTEYMKDAMRGKPIEEFPARANVGEIKHQAPVIVVPTQEPQVTASPDPGVSENPIPGPTGDGQGDGQGNGQGDGQGNGQGDGQGDGQGIGQGDGQGDGQPNQPDAPPTQDQPPGRPSVQPTDQGFDGGGAGDRDRGQGGGGGQ